MKVLLVLSSDQIIQRFNVMRCCESLRLYYGPCEIDIAAPDSFLEIYKQRKIDVIPFNIDKAVANWDRLALIYAKDFFAPIPPLAYQIQKRLSYPLVGFNAAHHIIHCCPVFPEERQNMPCFDANVFTRLAPPMDEPMGTYCYFPYSCLWIGPGIGPIDDFGFRIAADRESLLSRTADHKLIAVFGGSAAYSEACLYSEMFSQRLEERLNNEGPRGRHYTVLNFGVSRQVMMEEMMVYLFHGMPLKPDYVIAHDGFNDFLYAPLGDPALVGKHKMIYQTGLEILAQKMSPRHSRPSAARNAQEATSVVQSAPENIMKAFMFRKEQFETLCQNNGAHFIHGLQPVIYDKENLDPRETHYLHSFKKSPLFDIFSSYKLILELYSLLRKTLYWQNKANKIDFGPLFRKACANEQHFADICHMMPFGDEIIAAHYARYILEKEKEKEP